MPGSWDLASGSSLLIHSIFVFFWRQPTTFYHLRQPRQLHQYASINRGQGSKLKWTCCQRCASPVQEAASTSAGTRLRIPPTERTTWDTASRRRWADGRKAATSHGMPRQTMHRKIQTRPRKTAKLENVARRLRESRKQRRTPCPER